MMSSFQRLQVDNALFTAQRSSEFISISAEPEFAV